MLASRRQIQTCQGFIYVKRGLNSFDLVRIPVNLYVLPQKEMRQMNQTRRTAMLAGCWDYSRLERYGSRRDAGGAG